jgi:Tfp pilus assembly protein FimT
MLVIALIVILSAVSYPTFESMNGGFKLQAGGDALRAAWAQVRSKAMNDGVPYRFSVAPGSGNYRIAPDIPEYWSGGSANPTSSDPANQPLIREDALPKGVRFSSAQAVQMGDRSTSDDTIQASGTIDSASWSTVVVFLPDGTARSDAEVALLVAGARPLQLRIRGLTGVVSTGRL